MRWHIKKQSFLVKSIPKRSLGTRGKQIRDFMRTKYEEQASVAVQCSRAGFFCGGVLGRKLVFWGVNTFWYMYMNTAKVAITLPIAVLAIIDRMARQRHESRSSFIAKSMERVSQVLCEQEVAEAYDSVFSEEDVREEQRDWSEKLLKNSSHLLSL